jgi:flavin reductase (DIM6/NTAB) family NADH-FMN oxidoreductase RutF
MLIDFQKTNPTERYHLMTDIITPRPIAWVVTEGEVTNIAPFSYFTPISSEPPAVLISIGHRPDGSPKDTLRNLRETKRCTICIIEEDHLDPMIKSATSLPPERSEAEEFTIPTTAVLEGYPPIVTGIKAALMGHYLQEVDLKGSKTIPVIITIDHVYIDEMIISDPDKRKLSFDPMARMGGSYRKLGETIG